MDVFLFDTGEIRRRIGFEVGTGDGNERDKVDGKPMVQRVKVFEDEDEALMRLTSEDHFSVIRYHR